MKVVCVGCSFTDGLLQYQTKHNGTYPYILGRLLPEATIYNLGHKGSDNLFSLIMIEQAIKERKDIGHVSEMTFIGINTAEIKSHEKKNGFLEVIVDFTSEIISCVKDKENKVISGDPKKVKKVHDTWKFSKDIKSTSPNWLLISAES